MDKKPIHDRISGRLIIAGQEEIDATQPLLEALVDELGWDPGQIVSRPQWRVPASPSAKRKWPVDVAIFDDPANLRDAEHIRIICECKKPDVESGVEQLKIYLDREPHARIGIWFNGTDHRIVYKTGDGYEVAAVGTPLPRPTDPLVPTGTKTLSLKDLRQVRSLVPVFNRIRDRLAAQDSNVNRDEEILPDVSTLILLKILDEQDHRLNPSSPLGFQLHETPKKTADHIRKLLKSQVGRHPAAFASADTRFAIDDASIFYVVSELKDIKLLGNGDELVMEAFQVLRGKAYKGEEGQFFTPFDAVDLAVAAVDPTPDDRIVDPAGGSGSFVVAALEDVVHKIDRIDSLDESEKREVRGAFAKENLYVLDKDAVSVRLSRAYLSLLGCTSPHVYKVNSLKRSTWGDQADREIAEGSFDIVMTNPPFGSRLKIDIPTAREEKYEVCLNWKRDRTGKWTNTGEYVERDLGLVFLERGLRLLKPGGRMAIVLPDTYLFSDKYGWLVQWLGKFTITHSIAIPIELFEPHCRAKTSIIVLKKQAPRKGHKFIGVFGESFGRDKHGKTRFVFQDGRMTTEEDNDLKRAGELLRKRSPEESRLWFRVEQADAVRKGIVVAPYWWRRDAIEALEKFAADEDCDLVSVQDLMDAGDIEVFNGHGSPSSHYKGRGEIPYVKVTDIKNWRMNENPSYLIPKEIADKERRERYLKKFDLVMPTRASKNIGMFGVVMPWQKDCILTREIAIWRVAENASRIDWALLLMLASLKVVFKQYRHLVLMQMNREDLSERYRELILPIPRDPKKREAWAEPVRSYFESMVSARDAYDRLGEVLGSDRFADRP
ncbi:MAG: N-6 DNA methylase [Actinomycetota bacterium]